MKTTNKLSELVSECGKTAGYKTNILKSIVFLCDSDTVGNENDENNIICKRQHT